MHRFMCLEAPLASLPVDERLSSSSSKVAARAGRGRSRPVSSETGKPRRDGSCTTGRYGLLAGFSPSLTQPAMMYDSGMPSGWPAAANLLVSAGVVAP